MNVHCVCTILQCKKTNSEKGGLGLIRERQFVEGWYLKCQSSGRCNILFRNFSKLRRSSYLKQSSIWPFPVELLLASYVDQDSW